MNLRKVNNLFGYGLFLIGAGKVIILIVGIMIFLLSFSSNSAIDMTSVTTIISGILGFLQIVLAVGSVIMILLNINSEGEGIITGYLLGLGALFIELITPSFLLIFVFFLECSMYMTAGNKVRNKNPDYKSENKVSKKMIENTDWFYSDDYEKRGKKDKIEQKQSKEQNVFVNKNKNDFDDYNSVQNDKNYYQESNINDNSNKKIVILKENFITIFLVVLVLIIFSSLSIYVYKSLIAERNDYIAHKNSSISKENRKQNTIIKNEVVQNIAKQNNIKIESTENKEISASESIIIKAIELFNKCEYVSNLKLQNVYTNATKNDDKITIKCGVGQYAITTEVILNGNILYSNIVNSLEQPAEKMATQVLIASVFIDCIGQAKGYQVNELYSSLTLPDCESYTLENEGILIEMPEDNSSITIRVDLNNDFSFLKNR